MVYARLMKLSLTPSPLSAAAKSYGRPGARLVSAASTLQAPLADPMQHQSQYAPPQQQQQQQQQQPEAMPAAAPFRAFSSVDFYRQADVMTITAIPPSWKSTDNGAWVVDKGGALLFTFAKGLGKAGRPKAGEARFDWQNKQSIALSPVEFCTLVESAGATSRQEKAEFFHDPGMGTQNQGKLTKKMYGAKQQNGYAVNLHVASNSFSSGIILSPGEITTLQHLAAYLVPRLYGFDKIFY